MSKILAIDFGLKRTGIAITDEAKMFAFGLDTVDSVNLFNYLEITISKENVSIIVLGYPRNLDTSDTHITTNVQLLKKAIEEKFNEVKVEFEDERFTSKMASQSMHDAGATRKQKKQKELVDMVSATILLQSYLARS